MTLSGDQSAPRDGKSADAFRTISEVAAILDVPQHVLRFWESKFVQVKPLKRGGGRRYYRPADVDLLRSIRSLLYDNGYTIKGVQKLLREGVVRSDGTLAEGAEPKPASPVKTPSDIAVRPGDSANAIPAEKKRALETVLGELEALKDTLESVLKRR